MRKSTGTTPEPKPLPSPETLADAIVRISDEDDARRRAGPMSLGGPNRDRHRIGDPPSRVNPEPQVGSVKIDVAMWRRMGEEREAEQRAEARLHELAAILYRCDGGYLFQPREPHRTGPRASTNSGRGSLRCPSIRASTRGC